MMINGIQSIVLVITAYERTLSACNIMSTICLKMVFSGFCVM